MFIRQFTPSDLDAVVNIANDLPEWFDADARQRAIPIDVMHQQCYVAFADDLAVGFITLFVMEGRLNIGWIGVRKAFQRLGIGKALVQQAVEHAQALGLTAIAVYTLGDSVDYPPYVPTRAFYFASGFTIYQRCTTDNPGCPEEIRLVKKLEVGETCIVL